MDWKTVGEKVVDFAPLLGTLLGGPIGTAAGGLVKVLANELGLKAEEATPEKFMEILQLDPNAVLKFKEFEMAHKVEIQKLILESERMYLQDRQDARNRQVEVEKATGKRDVNLYILAWVNVIGFFGILALVILYEMPVSEVAKTALAMLFGALIGGYKDVQSYFFGSSKSSAEKTELLARK
jgi:hypothetical protein